MFSTSKKSADLTCPSRWSLPVLIEVASMVAVTVESSKRSPVTISPVNSSKRPLILLTIMCRTLKATSECAESMSQVPAT